MARPPKQVDPLDVARVIGTLGGTEEELAAALGISRQALYNRKGKNPELVDTLKQAKAEADERVEQSLYKRALGYACEDTYFSTFQGNVTATPYRKHYPPDTTACIFWLKNRKPQEWRDRTQLESVSEQEIAGLTNEESEWVREQMLATCRSGQC
jgi:hypothetical protein